jgi:hypothetical protein
MDFNKQLPRLPLRWSDHQYQGARLVKARVKRHCGDGRAFAYLSARAYNDLPGPGTQQLLLPRVWLKTKAILTEQIREQPMRGRNIEVELNRLFQR